MARNRQRAKQRQAARRAERGGGTPESREDDARADTPGHGGVPGVLGETPELVHEADLEAGAPPEDLGRSDQTLQHAPVEEDLDELDEDADYDYEDEEQPVDSGEPPAGGPRGVRGARDGAGEPDARHRNRLIAFLFASWAELQRVQWPDRKQLTSMTGIVLMFVLIAGGYLGLLDAIFSRVVKAIL